MVAGSSHPVVRNIDSSMPWCGNMGPSVLWECAVDNYIGSSLSCIIAAFYHLNKDSEWSTHVLECHTLGIYLLQPVFWHYFSF